jgi:hypothetical protein
MIEYEKKRRKKESETARADNERKQSILPSCGADHPIELRDLLAARLSAAIHFKRACSIVCIQF